MKNGIASSTKLSMPRAICWAKITPGSAPSAQMKISAASASAKPIAMPPARLSTKPISISGPAPGTVLGASAFQPNHTAINAPTIASASTMSRRPRRRN